MLETLRLERSEYLMRKALHDIHFEGFLIPKGWLVRIGIRESHRDAKILNPHDFNPDRFLTGSYEPKQYSPFWDSTEIVCGQGPDLWIGQKFVLELAGGFQWKVVQDGPRELGFFHWRPSSKFRVQMSQYLEVGTIFRFQMGAFCPGIHKVSHTFLLKAPSFTVIYRL